MGKGHHVSAMIRADVIQLQKGCHKWALLTAKSMFHMVSPTSSKCLVIASFFRVFLNCFPSLPLASCCLFFDAFYLFLSISNVSIVKAILTGHTSLSCFSLFLEPLHLRFPCNTTKSVKTFVSLNCSCGKRQFLQRIR